MWTTVKDIVSVISDIATALAFVAVAIQLGLIRRQNKVEGHEIFMQSEREIWLAALQSSDIAPNLLAAFWSNAPSVSRSEELFLAILLDNYEYQFIRYKRGFLSEELWSPIEKYIIHGLSTPLATSIWNDIKKFYVKDFVAHFDKKLRSSS